MCTRRAAGRLHLLRQYRPRLASGADVAHRMALGSSGVLCRWHSAEAAVRKVIPELSCGILQLTTSASACNIRLAGWFMR